MFLRELIIKKSFSLSCQPHLRLSSELRLGFPKRQTESRTGVTRGRGEGGKGNCCLMGIELLISEKAMAPHSSTLAWKTPWMEEPGRRQSMGSLRVGHD